MHNFAYLLTSSKHQKGKKTPTSYQRTTAKPHHLQSLGAHRMVPKAVQARNKKKQPVNSPSNHPLIKPPATQKKNIQTHTHTHTTKNTPGKNHIHNNIKHPPTLAS